MKTFKLVRDPRAFELMADETRRRVIYLLRAKEMTVSQIASELQMTPQAIYRHIRKLLPAGLVEVEKEARIDHFIETYYRATAEVFDFVHGETGGEEYVKKRTREVLQAIGQLGLHLRVEEKTISQMMKLSRAMNAMALKPDQEEKIARVEGVDFIGRQEIARYMNLLKMTDKQFQDWLNLQAEYRNLLKSAMIHEGDRPRIRRKGK